MKRKTCPYCGKTYPSKLAVKTHKKSCKYIPENADYQTMGEIKNDPKPRIHFVKLVNQYGLHSEWFPPLHEGVSSHNVRLVSGDGAVMTCHAAVLAAASQYLADLLKEHCKHDDNLLIVAQNTTQQQMSNFLQFLYVGKFIGNMEEVKGMKIILKEFQMPYNTDIMNASFKDVLAIDKIEAMDEGYADKADTKEDLVGIDTIDYTDSLTNGYVNMQKDALGIDADNYTGYIDNISTHKDVLSVKTDNYPLDMNKRYIDNVDLHNAIYPVNMFNGYKENLNLQNNIVGINTDNHIIDLTERYEDKVTINNGRIGLDTIMYPKDPTEGFKNDMRKDPKNENPVSLNKKRSKDDEVRDQVPSRKVKSKKKAFSVDKLKSECDYCEIKSRNLNETMKHVQTEHPDLFDMFAKIHIKTQCQYCDQKFLDKKQLYQHKKNLHPKTLPTAQRLIYNINDGLPFTGRECPYCHKFIKTKHIAYYKDHIEQHKNGTSHPYSCDACENKFTKSYYLRVHKKKHQLLDSPLLCNQCGSSFHAEFDYDKHNQTHPSKAKLIKKKRPIDPNFSAICSICGKTYTKKDAYMVHIKSAHEDEKLLKCPHCPAISSSLNNLNSHMKLHLPPTLQCEQCPKKFPTPHYLKRHVRSRHLDDNEKDFVCDKCGKGFNESSYAGYVGHLNMHAGLKPFKCRYCEMCYQNQSNRMAHEKSRHSHVYVKRSTDLKGVRINKREQAKQVMANSIH